MRPSAVLCLTAFATRPGKSRRGRWSLTVLWLRVRGAVGVERRAGGRQRDARRSAAMRRMRQGARGGTVAQLSAVRAHRILSEREWHREGHPEQEVGAWQSSR